LNFIPLLLALLHVCDGFGGHERSNNSLRPEKVIIFTQFNKREALRKPNNAPQIASNDNII
jgi:hypothetical protein